MDADQKSWLSGVFDRAAPTYDRVGDSYHDHFGRRLVESSGVRRGCRLLDVACGRGAVLVPAAERCGPEGQVLGIDFAPEMVEATRAAIGSRAGVDVRVMDAERLDLDGESFDAVLCSFGVFFFPAPEQAVAEMWRVLVPGGLVGLSSWTNDDDRWSWEGPLLRDLPVARRPSARPFDKAEDLEALVSGAGFTAVRTTLEHHEIVFGNEAEWWEWKWSYSVRGVLEQVDEEGRDAFRDAAFAAMQPLRDEGGFPMRLTAAFTFGEKPLAAQT